MFRALLRFYPATFREKYGLDTVELLQDRLSEARQQGRLRVAGFWIRTLSAVPAHGLLERLTALGSPPWRNAFGRDIVRTAVRSLTRSPASSAVMVLTLGLGIGANVALFSVLRSVLVRPLPYPEPDRLVQLWETNPGVDDQLHGPSPWNFSDWESEADRFDTMAAWYLTSGTYRTDRWVEEIRSAQVTPGFFATLGVEPLIGRDFLPEEVTRYGPVMLSHGLWSRLFGEDPAVVGRTIIASGISYQVVGVMPADFTFPDESVEAWVAWNLPNVYEDLPEARSWRFLRAVGRLAPEVTMRQAEEQLDAIAGGLMETWPDTNRGWDTSVTSLHEDTVGSVRGTLWMAFVAVSLILLVACANVANLLLAQTPRRRNEIGLRVALGATSGRIVSELLLENLFMGVLACAAGLAIGAGALELLIAMDAGQIPRLSEVGMDGTVFGFTFLITLLTCVLFGGAPLVQLLRRSTGTEGGRGSTAPRGHRRLREIFVGSQLAMVMVLLSAAGLFSLSLHEIRSVDPGIDPHNVATFRVSLDPSGGGDVATVNYYDGLLDRIAGLPGVRSVGAAQTLPLNPVGNDFRRPYRRLGTATESADAPTVQMRIVTDTYVQAMGMTVLDGSANLATVAADDPLVAVINRTLARQLYPGEQAVGRSFEIDFRGGWQAYRIAGVVQDVQHYGLRAETSPEVFLLHRQIPYVAMSIVARTNGDPSAWFEPLRQAVLEHRANQPAHNFVSMEALLGASVAEERFLSVLLGLFGAVGIVLGATGVYGVMAYSVNHRKAEIGIRMALGAEPANVTRSVLKDSLLIGAAGLAAGVAVAWSVGQLIEGLLYDVTPRDPRVTASVALGLLLVTWISAWVPARKAASIPPQEALRSE